MTLAMPLSTSTYWLIGARSWASPIRANFAASFGNCAFTSVERNAGSATLSRLAAASSSSPSFGRPSRGETAQIDRAEAAMKRCVSESHTAE